LYFISYLAIYYLFKVSEIKMIEPKRKNKTSTVKDGQNMVCFQLGNEEFGIDVEFQFPRLRRVFCGQEVSSFINEA